LRGIKPSIATALPECANPKPRVYLEDGELDAPVDDADAEGRRPRHLQRQNEEARRGRVRSDRDASPGQNILEGTETEATEGAYEGEGADAGVGARGERHGGCGGARRRDLNRRGVWGEGRRRGLCLRRGVEEDDPLGGLEVIWAVDDFWADEAYRFPPGGVFCCAGKRGPLVIEGSCVRSVYLRKSYIPSDSERFFLNHNSLEAQQQSSNSNPNPPPSTPPTSGALPPPPPRARPRPTALHCPNLIFFKKKSNISEKCCNILQNVDKK
jgi:hypothetical protein